MIKNILLLLLIIFAGYTYYWLDKTEQTDSFLSSAKDDAGIAGELVDEIVPIVEEKFAARDGWSEYINAEYNFSLQHPDEWEVQESLKPQNVRALHEISIHKSEFEMVRPTFLVRIFDNQDELSVDLWWDEWLAEEDAEKESCIEEYGDSAPCLYLRDRIENESDIEVGAEAAHVVRLFQFDSEGECNYVSLGKYVYGFCYDGANPNDPNFDDNIAVYTDILESVTFAAVIQDEVVSINELITGIWQSSDDALAYKEILDGGTIVDGYDGNSISTGDWKLIEEEGQSHLEVTDGEGELSIFSIVSIDDEKMVMTYLSRGNTLTYTRSQD